MLNILKSIVNAFISCLLSPSLHMRGSCTLLACVSTYRVEKKHCEELAAVVGFDFDCFEIFKVAKRHLLAERTVFHEVGFNVEVALFVLRKHGQKVHIDPLELQDAALRLTRGLL